jgi:KUP system potassium uptake protein
MASRMEIDEETGDHRGSMWNLDQKLDQPMDEEAMRLKSMSRNKVNLHFAFEGKFGSAI